MATSTRSAPLARTGVSLSKKAHKTRNRIKNAALLALNQHGYHNLRIVDITNKAGVASGLFYRYFKDLRNITYELCEDLFREINEDAKSVPFTLDPFDWFYEMHLRAGRRFSDNPGLLACMFELSGEFEEFAEIWKSSAHVWNLQVAKFLTEAAKLPPNSARQLAFVLGAMAEGIYYQTLIRHTSDLTKIGESPEMISQIIAVIWYRTVFFENPPASKVQPTLKIAKVHPPKPKSD